MDVADVMVIALKAMFAISLFGVVGKIAFPRSWLFRSHRHGHAPANATQNQAARGPVTLP